MDSLQIEEKVRKYIKRQMDSTEALEFEGLVMSNSDVADELEFQLALSEVVMTDFHNQLAPKLPLSAPNTQDKNGIDEALISNPVVAEELDFQLSSASKTDYNKLAPKLPLSMPMNTQGLLTQSVFYQRRYLYMAAASILLLIGLGCYLVSLNNAPQNNLATNHKEVVTPPPTIVSRADSLKEIVVSENTTKKDNTKLVDTHTSPPTDTQQTTKQVLKHTSILTDKNLSSGHIIGGETNMNANAAAIELGHNTKGRAGNNLTTTVNGVAAATVPIVNTNALTSVTNTITNATNGVSASAPNTVANAIDANTITTMVNGVANASVNLAPYLDNTNSQALSIIGNVISLTSGSSVTLPVTVNGVADRENATALGYTNNKNVILANFLKPFKEIYEGYYTLIDSIKINKKRILELYKNNLQDIATIKTLNLSYGMGISEEKEQYLKSIYLKEQQNKILPDPVVFFDKQGLPSTTTIYTYDSSNQVIAITYNKDGNVQNNQTQLSYNEQGNLVKATYPNGNTIQYFYDNIGNLIQIVNSQNNQTQLSYNEQGNLVKATYPNGNIIHYSYDAIGSLTQVTDTNGKNIQYSYDNSGKITQVTDANGNQVVFNYFDGNRAQLAEKLVSDFLKTVEQQNENIAALSNFREGIQKKKQELESLQIDKKK